MFLTLLISIGRPDLETVIIWSSPLACLRCCVAPVMSWNRSQRRSHQSDQKIEKQAEATREIQTCLGSYQELRGNTDPELTFICLERNAARIKACLRSNKKSSCCWAARVIVKEVRMLILCLVLCVHKGSVVVMQNMHPPMHSTTCTHYSFDSWFKYKRKRQLVHTFRSQFHRWSVSRCLRSRRSCFLNLCSYCRLETKLKNRQIQQVHTQIILEYKISAWLRP